MSDDDFSTVSAKRGERAREIEILRQQYLKHRDALTAMNDEAPSEHLANEYQRLIREIDTAMGKLDELASPVSRPLVTPPTIEEEIPAENGGGSQSRVVLILIIGVVVLAIIVYLIWLASSDRGPAVTETSTTTTVTTTAPVTTPPPAPEEPLAVSPASADYGTIRKGTRATRQFEISNRSEEPISIQVGRSTCHCLYYEHAAVVAPKGKESITVTVDGARAPVGELRETVKVSQKGSTTVEAMFEVHARIE
ncbi:MAG TPA: DUF1573 domain-containing protein [Thermoanaerobaculia bacterium]|nr:DUF1573 domain-containing protein [Thermoanaerobaculia bacterium]